VKVIYIYGEGSLKLATIQHKNKKAESVDLADPLCTTYGSLGICVPPVEKHWLTVLK
jgi:hypothetical protein